MVVRRRVSIRATGPQRGASCVRPDQARQFLRHRVAAVARVPVKPVTVALAEAQADLAA